MEGYTDISAIKKTVPLYQLHGVTNTNDAELTIIGEIDKKDITKNEIMHLADSEKMGEKICDTYMFLYTEVSEEVIKIVRVILHEEEKIMGDIIFQFEKKDETDTIMHGEYWLVNGRDNRKIKKIELYPTKDILMYYIIEELQNGEN